MRFEKLKPYMTYGNGDRIEDVWGRVIYEYEFVHWCNKFGIYIDINKLEVEYDKCIHEFHKLTEKNPRFSFGPSIKIPPEDLLEPEYVVGNMENIRTLKKRGSK